MAGIDPWLQTLEEAMRARPLLASLLADVHTVQQFYLFAPRLTAHQTAPEKPAAAQPALSVVVIAFNEEQCLVPYVRELEDTLGKEGVDYELVLVDDGSTDRTPELMAQLAESNRRIVVCRQQNKGIGGALRTGFDAARGRHLTWVPADGQIGGDTVLSLYRRRNEATLLTTVYRSRDDAWYRHIISQSLNLMIRVKTGQVAKSGGNYLFPRWAWQRFRPNDDSMVANTRFRHSIRAAGESVVEVEIDCRARLAGRSKVLNIKTIWRTVESVLGMKE